MAISSGILIEFDQSKMAEITAAIKALGDDRDKKAEMLKILKRQAKQVIPVMRSHQPVADKVVKYHRKDNVFYNPGNLQESNRIFTGRNKGYPTVFVGPQAKKPEGSGYYGFFVLHGTSGRRAIIKGKNDFLTKTMRQIGPSVGSNILDNTEKYIKMRASQLGFTTL